MAVSLFLEVATSVVGVAMSCAHFPQAYRMWKTKSSHDVSLLMYSIFFLGMFVWLAYGIALGSPAIIITYIVSVVSTSLAFGLAVYYRVNRKKQHKRKSL